MKAASQQASVLLLGILAAAGVQVGCNSKSSLSGVSGAPLPPYSLVRRIPADLQYREPPEDAKAQARYLKAVALAKTLDLSGSSFSGKAGISDFSRVLEISDLLEEGPVQYSEEGGGGSKRPGGDGRMLARRVTAFLNNGAQQAFLLDERAKAVRLKRAALKWAFQTGDVLEAQPMTAVDSGHTILYHSHTGWSEEEKSAVLEALPDQTYWAERWKRKVAELLEEAVLELESLWSPRSDLLISRRLVSDGFTSSPNPSVAREFQPPSYLAKSAILVPPHGTLEREKTFDLLIDAARKTMRAMERKSLDSQAPRSDWIDELVQWIPPTPEPLETVTAEERVSKEQEIKDYVREMNSEKNTLGRSLLKKRLYAMNSPRDDLADRVRSFIRLFTDP